MRWNLRAAALDRGITTVLACMPNDLLLPAAESSTDLRPRRRTGHDATL